MGDFREELLSCLDLEWKGDEAWLCTTLLDSLFPINEGDDDDDDQFSDQDHDINDGEIIELEPDFLDIIEEALEKILFDDLASPKMRPASETAIKGLEKVKIDQRSGDEASSCTVCFEEISVDTEAVRLPCTHVYHEGCIVKWLNESHTCPLCRNQMPVVNFDLNLSHMNVDDFDLNLPPTPGLDSDGDSMMTAADSSLI